MDTERKTNSQQKIEEVIESLERLTVLLKGDTITAGVIPRLEKLEGVLIGNDKDMGLRNRVNIMWIGARVLTGAVCTFAGYLMHPYLTKLVALLK